MKTEEACAPRSAPRHHLGGKTFVALIATAALTFGPGAMTAFAEDGVPPDTVGTEEVTDSQLMSEDENEDLVDDSANSGSAEDGVDDSTDSTGDDSADVGEDDGTDEAEGSGDDSTSDDEFGTFSIEQGEFSARGGNKHPGDDSCRDNGENTPRVLEFAKDKGRGDWDNDCEKRDRPDDPKIKVNVDQCMTYRDEVPSEAWLKISQLDDRYSYKVVVTGPNGFHQVTKLETNKSWTSINQSLNGPGDYVVTVTGKLMKNHDERGWNNNHWNKLPKRVTGSQEFTVNDCPQKPKPTDPVVMVDVNQCMPPNGVVPSTVAVTATGLNHRYSYRLEVTGPNGFAETAGG